MIKRYGKKQVKFGFHFDKNGKNIIDILEQCYQNEIRNEQILTRKNHEVQKNLKIILCKYKKYN